MLMIQALTPPSRLGTAIRDDHCAKAAKLAKDNILLQMRHWLSTVKTPQNGFMTEALDKYLTTDIITDDIQTLFTYHKRLTSLIDKLGKPQYRFRQQENIPNRTDRVSKECTWTDGVTGLKVTWSQRLCTVALRGELFVLPRPCIQQMHNKIADLLSVLLYTRCAEKAELPTGSYQTTVQYVKELCLLHIDSPHRFFDIVKSLEAVVVAKTLDEIDNEWPQGNTGFLNSLAADLYTVADFNLEKSEVGKILYAAPIELRHELGALSKVTGHPMVDMKAGSEALHKLTTAESNINAGLVVDSTNTLMLSYIQTYATTRQVWPPMKLDRDAPPVLQYARRRGLIPSSRILEVRYGRTITIDDMVYVQLEQDMIFDKVVNIIPELKDRTISALRSRVVSTILSATQKQKKERLTTKETRLLLYFITNVGEVLDHVKYLDEYTYGQLNEIRDYLVLRVVPKEKELKRKFRGFGCKSYKDRARSLVQEKNVKRFLSNYNNDQAMTLNELELIRRLSGYRRISTSYPGFVPVYISIDAEKWNNKFRPSTVRPVMERTFDKIFGYPIFGKTMEAYEHTLFYVPDEDEVYWWDGHSGGVEGLNQDTWVAVYVAQIRLALKKFDPNMPFHILCKGDDLRVVVMVSPQVLAASSIGDVKDDVVAAIRDTLKDFNQTIKLEESYGSGRYLAFSKRASVDTIGLPMVFRKIEKVYGANNAMFPFTDDYTGASFSNAHSAAKEGPVFLSCYFVALFWAYSYQLGHKSFRRLTDLEQLGLMLVPSMLGGHPIIYLTDMGVRAEADHFPHFICLLKWLQSERHPLFDILRKFLTFEKKTPRAAADYAGLMADIYSLPIVKPSLPSSILRKKLEEVIHMVAVNPVITDLYRAKELGITESVLKVLASSDVLDPRLMSNIYSATPTPLLRELLALFETSSSIREALLLRMSARQTDNLFDRVTRADIAYQDWKVQTLHSNFDANHQAYRMFLEEECPAEIANNIRCWAWEKKIVNVTNPPMLHLMSYTANLGPLASEYERQNHFTYRILTDLKYLPGAKSLHYSSGRPDPFLGHTTPTGNLAPTVNIIAKDVLLNKVKNLLDIIAWADQEETIDGVTTRSNLPDLIEYLIGCYTGMLAEELAPFTKRRRTGTIAHHMRTRDTRESIMPNDITNRGQLVAGLSNTHLTARLDNNKYRLNFLQILCHSVISLTIELDFSKGVTMPCEVWGLTTDCKHCWTPLKDPCITVDLAYLNPALKFAPDLMIAQSSQTILRESLGMFDPEVLKPTNYAESNLEMRVASLTLMMELFDKTWELKTRLSDQHGGHVTTPEGAEVLRFASGHTSQPVTRISELKHIPVEYMYEAITHRIHYYLDTTEAFQRKDDEEIAALLWSLPPAAFPWTDTLALIYEAGRLGDLLTHIEFRTKITPPMCYTSPGLSAAYLGVSLLLSTRFNVVRPIITDYRYVAAKNLYARINIFLPSMRRYLTRKFSSWLRKHQKKRNELEDAHTAVFCAIWLSDGPTEEQILESTKTQEALDGDPVLLALNLTELPAEWDTLGGMPLPMIMKMNPGLKNAKRQWPSLNWSKGVMSYQDSLQSSTFWIDKSGVKESNFIEVYITLAERCVSIVRASPMLLERPTDIPTDLPAGIMPRLKRPVPSTWLTPVKQTGWGLGRASLIDRVYLQPDFPQVYLPDKAFCNRILGKSNSACNKYAEIFAAVGLLKRRGSRLMAACLADGQGGTTDMIMRTFPQSCVLYVSNPEGKVPTLFPEVARAARTQTESVVLYKSNLERLNDISDKDVMQHYIDQGLYYNIVTMDAPLSPQENRKGDIWINTVRFFLHCSHQNSVLVMKMDWCNTRFMCLMSYVVLSFLPKSYVFFAKPPSSRNNHECYMVAVKCQSSGSCSYDALEELFLATDVPLCVYKSVKDFQSKLVDKMRRDKGLIMYRPCLAPKILRLNMHWWIQMLCSRLVPTAAYLVDVQSLNTGAVGPKDLESHLGAQALLLLSNMENPDSVCLAKNFSLNKLTRKMEIAKELLLLEGCKHWVHRVATDDVLQHPSRLINVAETSAGSFKMQYVEVMRLILPRLSSSLNATRALLFTENWPLHHTTWSPWITYCRGVEWGMSITTALLVNEKDELRK
jgi:hypothetical protein